MPFLPINHEEMIARGWSQCDIVVVTGDGYVDHPSFGAAVIARVLEDAGFRVGILAQPQTDADYRRLGQPLLGFFVTGGNIDSMVAHYTAAKRKRSTDSYSPGGKAGLRPDRATIVYCKAIRRLYGDIPLVIGGLEASLRRFAHYDYWDDTVRPSILLDSGADLLVYGMGELAAIEIAKRLQNGEPIDTIQDVRGSCFAVATTDYTPRPCAECPSYEVVREQSESGKKQYAMAARLQQDEQDAVRGKTIIQRHGSMIVVQNPPMPPLDGAALDAVFALPYERAAHPSYAAQGGIPAIEEVEFSIIHNRGCFGACTFCALAFHQGRTVTARTPDSVVREAELLTRQPGFKGYIHDIGGPTANFRKPACEGQKTKGVCKDKHCLAPEICAAVRPDHSEYLSILRRVRTLAGVKKVFVRSGIRFDYLLADRDESFFKELVAHHVSGQLKVAPEHCSNAVLDYMGKPHFEVYKRFQKRFYELSGAAGKEQYLVPYMISSHPGSTLHDAIELALYLKREGIRPEQVQDFYPTPGTIATAMYYSGVDPYTRKPVYVPRAPKEKAAQRALLQFYRKENAAVVREALLRAGRADLIGSGRDCLVPPASGCVQGQAVKNKKTDKPTKTTGKHSGKRRK